MFFIFFAFSTNKPISQVPFLYSLIVTAHKETKIWYRKGFPHLGTGAICVIVLAAYFIAVSLLLSP